MPLAGGEKFPSVYVTLNLTNKTTVCANLVAPPANQNSSFSFIRFIFHNEVGLRLDTELTDCYSGSSASFRRDDQ